MSFGFIKVKPVLKVYQQVIMGKRLSGDTWCDQITNIDNTPIVHTVVHINTVSKKMDCKWQENYNYCYLHSFFNTSDNFFVKQ